MLTAVVHTRVVSAADAEELLALLLDNREFLAPWQPTAPADALTLGFQAESLKRLEQDRMAGRSEPRVIVDGERIVGRITLSQIARGPFLSCHLGYWVAEADNGRGHATAAVGEICTLAFSEFGLHRVQAGTLTHNAGSQRVLRRNGFEQIGLAPRYLRIAGRWQDHVLFQRLAD